MPAHASTFWKTIGFDDPATEFWEPDTPADVLDAKLRDLNRRRRNVLGCIAEPPTYSGNPRTGWTREMLDWSLKQIEGRIAETEAEIRRERLTPCRPGSPG
jgi:hypothetical protein